MKEKPILFNAAMVRAILDGRKTQTRRIMNPQPELISKENECGDPGYWIPFHAAKTMVRNQEMSIACPLGQPGDRLWVRETFALIWPEDSAPENIQDNNVEYRADTDGKCLPGEWPMEEKGGWGVPTWKPSIHMPRWASRIDLLITGVRVERLQDISDRDALAEGCPVQLPVNPQDNHKPRTWFRGVWSEIYGEESWSANPWAWVIEFKKL